MKSKYNSVEIKIADIIKQKRTLYRVESFFKKATT